MQTVNKQLTIAESHRGRVSQRKQLLAREGHQRTECYSQFLQHLKNMALPEKQRLQFGDPSSILWKALTTIRPPRFEAKYVTDPVNPGDGICFENNQILRATNIVIDYYEAWSEAIVQSLQQDSAASEGLPKVDIVTKLGQICLVLDILEGRELLKCFCNGEHAAFDLPLKEETLVKVFGDKYQAQRFATEQYRVVSRAWTSNQAIPPIPKEEPLPFKQEDVYGIGGYSLVYKVRDVRTNKLYARKDQRFDNAACEEHFKTDLKNMGRAHHRHVIKHVNHFKRDWKNIFLLEPAADGNLSDLFFKYSDKARSLDEYVSTAKLATSESVAAKSATARSRKSLNEHTNILLNVFGCMASTVRYLHSRSIIHKDIKPQNILYLQEGGQHSIILADFGLAHDFSKNQFTGTDSGMKGTMKYAPPGRSDRSWVLSYSAKTSLTPENESTAEYSADSESVHSTERPTKPPHGRIDDVFLLGCVYFEILSTLVHSKIPGIDDDDFTFATRREEIERWASEQMNHSSCPEHLKLLFGLALHMTKHEHADRCEIQFAHETLSKSKYIKQFYCVQCQRQLTREEMSETSGKAPERSNRFEDQSSQSRSGDPSARKPSNSQSTHSPSRSKNKASKPLVDPQIESSHKSI